MESAQRIGRMKFMGVPELLIVAIALSMDAFAVAICQGLAMKRAGMKQAVAVGLYFGLFQAIMPFIGFECASYFAGYIEELDHWIAFVLLSVIGGNMVKEALSKDGDAPTMPCAEPELGPVKMIPLAIATSIDALAMGITFAVLRVRIVSAVSLIGLTTFAFSFAGVYIGHSFGARFEKKAELAGGLILIAIGAKILLEHIGML